MIRPLRFKLFQFFKQHSRIVSSGDQPKKDLVDSTVLALKMTIPPSVLLVLITRFSLVNVVSISVWGLFTLVWTVVVALDYGKREGKKA